MQPHLFKGNPVAIQIAIKILHIKFDFPPRWVLWLHYDISSPQSHETKSNSSEQKTPLFRVPHRGNNPTTSFLGEIKKRAEQDFGVGKLQMKLRLFEQGRKFEYQKPQVSLIGTTKKGTLSPKLPVFGGQKTQKTNPFIFQPWDFQRKPLLVPRKVFSSHPKLSMWQDMKQT